jgi:ATP-binding cassette subfamily G (WHITE) protein 2 (PDR)
MKDFAQHMRDVIMAIFGISHTINTVVGNDFIRGVSGGERKRVTIAEAALSGAPLQCWDNSTRGLDSANAIEFCKNLRLGAEFVGTTSVVAIYQAPQSAYDLFDKVSVLYEGEQIFFGKTTEAKAFFTNMGFACPEQQTTPDFLTSLTSPNERTPREGFEGKVPTSPQEFATAWRKSPEYAKLLEDIAAFNDTHPVHGERYDQFLASRRAQQSKHVYVDWSRFSQSVATPAHVCQVCQIPLHPLLYGPDQPLSQTRLLASQGGPESDHLPTVR